MKRNSRRRRPRIYDSYDSLWPPLIKSDPLSNFILVAWPKIGQRGIDYTRKKNLSFRLKEWEWKGEIRNCTTIQTYRLSRKILIIRKKPRAMIVASSGVHPSIRLLRGANNNGTKWKIRRTLDRSEIKILGHRDMEGKSLLYPINIMFFSKRRVEGGLN